MTFHVFLPLLLFVLMFALAWLCSLCWSHHCPPEVRAAATMHTTLQRLLKPRSPLDCSACRLTSTFSSVGGPAPLPVRPWSEVKSRRGEPKRVNTEASPVLTTRARIPGSQMLKSTRLFGDGKHGHAERIQTFRGPACGTTFSARRHTV